MIDIYKDFLSEIIKDQQEINTLITTYFDKLDSGDEKMYLYILGISFLYGLVHALGPGHGKMIISSYFLAHGSKIKEALKAGFLTSIIHTMTALLITGSLYIFFQRTISKYFQIINENMYKVSAIFIILIATFLLYESIKQKNIKEKLVPIKNKNILSIAVSIGIVPCPGVMTIVLYSMLLGYTYLGIFSAISMSIGMGITISLAAVASSSLKNSYYINTYFMNIMGYIGIFLMFLLGFLLLL